ncbi:hypothetical protein M9Y10_040043 [Tritrichomonas musculus]|uniref:Protein kinase domain-containing protein n=1 Tax=Tritrichomonas musculus TaxID=1915356 RepID=A0ABR2GQZ6_9EUKA
MNEELSSLIIDRSTLKNVNLIAVGTFGNVKKGILPGNENQPNKIYAIYDINPSLIQDEKEQEGFYNEIRCLNSLNHEAILKFIGFSIPTESDSNYSIICEYMKNDTLKKLIQDVERSHAPANWDTIKAINIFGIAAGMAYIHQHNVIHRDLKPSNVFLDSNFYPKIGDFGLSKFFIEGTENELNQTLNVGTPIYMAPEVIENSHYSNKIDVFSYSIILYQLLTQNEPYYDAERLNAFTLFKNVAGGVRPTICPCEINSQFMKLIERCWSGDPDNRPSFIQIVKKYMDCRDEFFNDQYLDDEQFDDYIEIVTKDLDFSNVEDFIL